MKSQDLGRDVRLYREDLPNRWFFLLLHQIFAAITDNPDFYDADSAMPVLEILSHRALDGIDAIEQRNDSLLIPLANQLTEVYCAIP
jgi:hypothetical protein